MHRAGSIMNGKLFVNGTWFLIFFFFFFLDETMQLSETIDLYNVIKP